LSKLKSSEAHLQESRAKLDKDSAIHARLETAAKVPGTISGGELDKSARDVDFDQAHVRSVEEEVHAAKSIVEARKKQVSAAQQEYKAMESTLEYLTIKAPFEGVITERNVHEGSLVGFESDKTARIALRIQQISTLRLVVYVPEDDVSGVIPGTSMEFAVKAYPGRRFTGVVKRVGHALDRETRTMPVELDVKNGDGKLEPGMFANVFWPEKRPYDTLFVPSTAVFTSLSGDFVIKVDGDRTNVVKVTRGKTVNDLQEVFGNLKGGDRVVLHGSEEMESGTRVQARLATSKDL
ncbi:MAG: efflux RND transporter periplasmic adaptor subunit, partial [Candidatus Obscuribacterales bacterium]